MKRAQTKLARDLSTGDYIRTSIGYAPITGIEPDHGGLAVHLDLGHERCTRPRSETSVLWLYPGERIHFWPVTNPPPANKTRVEAREVGARKIGAVRGANQGSSR